MNHDLISRDAVLDACSQSINILDAMSRIEDLPSVKSKQRWIPVSERLPEDGQSILVTTTNGLYVVAIIRTYFKDIHKDIIAWMPLPKPYDPQEKESEEQA